MNDAPPQVGRAANRRGWWIHLSLVTLYLALIGGLARYRSQTRDLPALTSSSSGLTIVCATDLLVFGVVLGLAVLASRASRDDLLLRWRHGPWPIPLGVAYAVALRLVLVLVVAMIGVVLLGTHLMSVRSLHHFVADNRPDVAAVVDVSSLRHDRLYFWLSLTLVSFLVGGVREELWRSAFIGGLRRLWPHRFGSRDGAVLAVTIAAVLFGIAHLYMGLLAVVFAGVIGFGLGLVMVFHRSIWPAVIAHGVFDATTLALLPWLATKMPELQRTLGH